MGFWWIWLQLFWTLALAGEAQCHFLHFGGPLSFLILESQLEPPQLAWHKAHLRNCFSKGKNCCTHYINVQIHFLSAWGGIFVQENPSVLLSSVSLWGSGFLLATKWGAKLSETTLFISLLVRYAIDQTWYALPSHASDWLQCVYFIVFKWSMHKTNSSCLGQITAKQGRRAVWSVLPFLSCSLSLWGSREFSTARVQGNLAEKKYQFKIQGTCVFIYEKKNLSTSVLENKRGKR